MTQLVAIRSNSLETQQGDQDRKALVYRGRFGGGLFQTESRTHAGEQTYLLAMAHCFGLATLRQR
jgi:hypothetical protein